MTASAGPLAEGVTDVGGDALWRLMERVEQRMDVLARGHGPGLARHAGETLSAGGKRLRPLLVCLSAGAPPPESDGVVHGAVAVELVHAATLVHDDVLDGSKLRRGRPTVVATGGRRLATATGDLLFSRAFAELAQDSVEGVRILSRGCRELALGELMQRADMFSGDVSEERYLERCRLKTAVLFRAACELGALQGGLAPGPLGDFGERIGLAFQILDDVLDVSGAPERTGKPRGADLLDGTVTLPLILARAGDPQLASVDLRRLAGPADAARLCDRIAATGALTATRERALEVTAQAKRMLPDLPDRQRTALRVVADRVVDRYA